MLESGDDGGALTDDERSYLRAFNGQWLAKGQPLTAQICKFLVAIYKADNMTAEELKVDPGLTVTQDIINSKRQITIVKHQAFIVGVTNVTEKLFSSHEVKAEMSAANRKCKREGQLSTLNKPQLLALEKFLQLDKFITLEIGVR